jgi:mTERF domain-containing protein, mitochondrial
MAQYLISSFGFSRNRAIKHAADPHLTAIQSPDQPEAVVQFLKEIGLSDSLVKRSITFCPSLLSYNVEKTLKPNASKLVKGGLSSDILFQLIQYNPKLLLNKDALPRLLFWKDFVGKCDKSLVKLVRKNRLLIMYDIEKQIVPRMNLLKEFEFSHQDIVGMLVNCSLMSRNLDSIRKQFEQIEELRLKRGCSMFLRAVKELGDCSIDKMKRNAEFYQTAYGWSKEEVCLAFTKFPNILRLSMDKIKSNMNFLNREAKLEPRSIASHPLLLGYSLEKRLILRFHVLSILAANGVKNGCSFPSACSYSENYFLKKFIEPYKKDVPELADAYFAASSRNTTGPV